MSPTWPNLFVLGAPKAGTTSLFAYLGRHPEVFPATVKEPHYFSHLETTSRLRGLLPPRPSERYYLSLFSGHTHERWLCEASTSYLFDLAATERIRRHSSDARAIIILRDPVERVRSHYWNNVRDGLEDRSLYAAILDEVRGAVRNDWFRSYLAISKYEQQLSSALAVFGDALLVLIFEEFFLDPQVGMRTVFDFLGVDPAVSATIPYRVHNPTAVPRSRAVRAMIANPSLRKLGRTMFTRRARSWTYGRAMKPATSPPWDPIARALADQELASTRLAVERILGRSVPSWAPATDGQGGIQADGSTAA